MNFSMLWEKLKDRGALHIAVDGVSKVKHDSATEEIFSKQKGLPPHTIQPTRGGKGGKQIYLIPPEHKQSHTQQKPTQNTGSTQLTKGRNQKEEGIQLKSLGKGDLKHSKFKKKKRKKKSIAQMKEKTRNIQDQLKKRK